MYCVFFSVGNRFDETRGLRKNKGWNVASLFRIQKSPPQWSVCLAPLSSITHYWKSHLRSSKHQATGSREGRYEYNLSPDTRQGPDRLGQGGQGRSATLWTGGELGVRLGPAWGDWTQVATWAATEMKSQTFIRNQYNMRKIGILGLWKVKISVWQLQSMLESKSRSTTRVILKIFCWIVMIKC